MTTDTRAALATQQKPVAYLWQHSETGRTRVVMPDQIITADATWVVVGPLYFAPAAPARKPLTDAEINALMPNPTKLFEDDDNIVLGYTPKQIREVARAIERAHGITGETK